GRLQVAVDDSLLVRMLHGFTDIDEESQPLSDSNVVLIAEVGNGDATDEFHDEIRVAGGGGAAVKNVSDVGMIHECQRLPLGLEAGDDLARIHSRFKNLQSDLAPNRLGLVCHKDHTEAAFADLLQELIRADDRAGAFGKRLIQGNA